MYTQSIPWKVNYDESEIPDYTLPELMRCNDGTIVSTPDEWLQKRRPELVKMFQDVMYGAQLPLPDKVNSRVLSEKKNALGGQAIRREVRLTFSMKNGGSHYADILYYVPAKAKGKVPVFIGLTFGGNHVISEEEDILITGLKYAGFCDFIKERGAQSRRFPLKQILGRGYGIAVASYHDFFPDHEQGWKDSIFSIYPGMIEESGIPECKGNLPFPQQWTTFLNVSPDLQPSADQLCTIPESLAGVTPQLHNLQNDRIDFHALAGSKETGICNWAFAELNAPEECEYTLGGGADWWMKIFVNGEPVIDTEDVGNDSTRFAISNHTATVRLKKGGNIIAVRMLTGVNCGILCLGGAPDLKHLIDQGDYRIPPRRPADYSSVGAWSWGISRMLDYLRTVPEIDGDKAAVFGHSRLGKTALWTGVLDQRFKLACVNDSGCGGAALSRRLYGETLFSMYHKNTIGRWWFTDTLEAKSLHPENLPLDQHELIALVAPRAVAVHSATEDQWADPKSEYLSAYYAGEAFRLFGKEPLESPEPPPPETPVGTDVSYFLRTGKHDLLLSDWNHYMDMADRIFAGEQ